MYVFPSTVETRKLEQSLRWFWTLTLYKLICAKYCLGDCTSTKYFRHLVGKKAVITWHITKCIQLSLKKKTTNARLMCTVVSFIIYFGLLEFTPWSSELIFKKRNDCGFHECQYTCSRFFTAYCDEYFVCKFRRFRKKIHI